MTWSGGNHSPLTYSAYANTGVAATISIAALYCGRNSRIRWSALISRDVNCWPLTAAMVARLSFPLYVAAGYYVDYGIVTALTAFAPLSSLIQSWLARRNTTRNQRLSRQTLALIPVGLTGAVCASLAQDAGDAGAALRDPIPAVIAAAIVLISCVMSGAQCLTMRFWINNCQRLHAGAGVANPYGRENYFFQFAATAGCAGLISMACFSATFIRHEPAIVVMPAFANGLLVGSGLIIASYGSLTARTPAAHLGRYAEIVIGLGLLYLSGLSRTLNWPLLAIGALLLIAVGSAAARSETRNHVSHHPQPE